MNFLGGQLTSIYTQLSQYYAVSSRFHTDTLNISQQSLANLQEDVQRFGTTLYRSLAHLEDEQPKFVGLLNESLSTLREFLECLESRLSPAMNNYLSSHLTVGLSEVSWGCFLHAVHKLFLYIVEVATISDFSTSLCGWCAQNTLMSFSSRHCLTTLMTTWRP